MPDSGKNHPDIAAARIRLAELDTLINSLIVERQNLRDTLDAVIYPVSSLPPEILSHIFVRCLSSKRPAKHLAPLLLTQICRLWREIALATPELWQAVALNARRDMVAHAHQNPERLLEMWLDRSATLPLTLSLGGLQSLVDMAMTHHDRWCEVTLESDAAITEPEARGKVFSNLRVLELTDWSQDPHTVVIENAPVLKEVHFTVFSIENMNLRLPFAQIEKIGFQTFDNAATCVPILLQCTNLVHIDTKTLVVQTMTDLFLDPHVTLDSVESLNINYIGSTIVPHVTLPALRQLTLSEEVDTAVGPFRALSARSGCSLQELTIIVDQHNYKMRSLHLTQFFEVFPSVTTLRLDFRDHALYRFINALSSADILPSMHTLTIDSVRERDDYDILLDILRARSPAGNGTLVNLTLLLRSTAKSSSVDARGLPGFMMDHFRDIAAEGMRIQIFLDGTLLLDV
ncbi:hypothetical protein R3P38DRAFT_2982623 [Favolaschia claudopus]|uniref:F-box domain-containing protein n=1 Tax=Favolaschia claudopus TaxID=2862362 RepID=A0AAW0AYK9_9AGAR